MGMDQSAKRRNAERGKCPQSWTALGSGLGPVRHSGCSPRSASDVRHFGLYPSNLSQKFWETQTHGVWVKCEVQVCEVSVTLKVTVGLQTEIAHERLDSGFGTNAHTSAMKPLAVVTSYPLHIHATTTLAQQQINLVTDCACAMVCIANDLSWFC